MSYAENRRRSLAVLGVSAFFHDVGKASVLFQNKFDEGRDSAQEAVRHEVISAAVFDHLVGDASDDDLARRINRLTRQDYAEGWFAAASYVRNAALDVFAPLPFRFLSGDKLARSVGTLILTHHRMPSTTNGLPDSRKMVRPEMMSGCLDDLISPTPGLPFWEDEQLVSRLSSHLPHLTPGPFFVADPFLRIALCTGDTSASMKRELRAERPEHAANLNGDQWGDSLAEHTGKVMTLSEAAFALMIDGRMSWPSVSADELGEAGRLPGGVFVDLTGTTEPLVRTAARLLTSREHGLRATIVSPVENSDHERARKLVKQHGMRTRWIMTYRDTPMNFEPPPVELGGPVEQLSVMNPFIDRFGVMSAPLLLCGFEQARKAGSPQYSKDLIVPQRLMSGDLIVEDAHALPGERWAELNRLVELAGQAGRGVIIGGEQVDERLIDEARAHYEAGWAEFCLITQGADAIVAMNEPRTYPTDDAPAF